jgi:uncharacterized protein YndB with AHSA1/START domain
VPNDYPIVKKLFIQAPPEVIFEYFTDPAKLIQWIGLRAELDPRPGGLFRMEPSDVEALCGMYLEVVPHSKLVFTWGFEKGNRQLPPGSSVVEVHFLPEGTGTRLRLIHRNLPDKERERHEAGWKRHLARLQIVLAGGDPGPNEPCTPP